MPEENCTTYAANETRDLTGPYGFGRIFQLRSPAEGHQERGMGIGLKRVLAVALIVVFLCSVSVASAAGSLLPFDHEWTAAEVRARIAAGARVNARDDDGLAVGSSATAEKFLSLKTLQILTLGLFAFSAGIACGVLLGKLMYKLSGGKVNPLIGAAGISAVPMAARVCQQVGLEEDPNNHLLMHAMGANVGGQIASAVAAGVMMAIFS